MKIQLPLLAVAAVLITTPALANDSSAEVNSKVEYKDDGSVKKTHKEVAKDAAGTKTTVESKAEVNVDSNGVEKTYTAEKTVDPKGLMNKETTKTETKVDKDGKVTTSVKH